MFEIDFQNPSQVFFVGIGGISMSGLAEILKLWGFSVSGSDRQKSEITEHLEAQGIPVHIGQRRGNITPSIDFAVLTSAIHSDNPEFIELSAYKIPCLSRAELLGQMMRCYRLPIAVSGTHGKTTTTSMLSEILLFADTDPTLLVGGVLPSIGGNLRIGANEYFVTEACEYTNSFLSFSPKYSIILNIEEDHLDFFQDLAQIRDSFRQFASLLPPDGVLVLWDGIENFEEITKDCLAKVVTYGTSDTSDYQLQDWSTPEKGGGAFSLRKRDGEVRSYELQVPGFHNILNASAACVMADALEISPSVVQSALANFGGTKRRFEEKGELCGIRIVDDYAHHSTEIKATLTAAKAQKHREIWCVFQPHTYTRTKALLNEFAQALSLADHVVLADIYAARETNVYGISSTDLQAKILELGVDCSYFSTFNEIEIFLLGKCTKGDLLITMGAGDIYKVGDNLLGI
ncbi:MAG: UDP-N-acetylmuramate--L-alanine ligase [Clostridium sp.]|nr:UDP-N-acetylmuramate--L-alanine ligase [Clostridium sp.]